MPDVRMPDGVVVRFPPDMPPNQIRDLVAQKFPKEAENAKRNSASYSDMPTGYQVVQNNPFADLIPKHPWRLTGPDKPWRLTGPDNEAQGSEA